MGFDEESCSIGELAREFGITTRTIRFYEDEGLLTPLRAGTRRLFSPRERTRLKLILRGKRLGFQLSEIAEIINLYNQAPGEEGQLHLLLEKIDARRQELLVKRADIDESLGDLRTVEERCHGRLAELANKGNES